MDEDQWIYDNIMSEEVNMNEENREEPGVNEENKRNLVCFNILIILMPSIFLRY